MYKSFFQLQSNPFGGSPDPRFLYMMPHTREALAGLEFGISTRKGFIVLTGEVGTGKTTLLRRALASFDPSQVLTSFVFNPRLEVLDFLEFVLSDFGLTPTSRTKSGMLIQLNRWLVERFRQEQVCVIVVDEAQNLSWELLEEIRLLTNLEASSEKLLQIVLSGQPEFEDKLRQTELRQLRQRVALWCRTQPLTEEQTATYIDQRLLTARAPGTNSTVEGDQPIFSPDAIPLIHRASHGIPRIINLICEHSLIFAYVEDLHHIPAAMVSAVIQDLDLEPPSVVISSPLHKYGEAVSTSRAVSALSLRLRPEVLGESGQDR
jgi:general secretion pathway protein A